MRGRTLAIQRKRLRHPKPYMGYRAIPNTFRTARHIYRCNQLGRPVHTMGIKMRDLRARNLIRSTGKKWAFRPTDWILTPGSFRKTSRARGFSCGVGAGATIVP